jgi:hypothetical protein
MQRWAKPVIAFWILNIVVSTTCFGADIHFCQGEVQSYAIFDTAKPCEMAQKKAVEAKPSSCCMARKVQEKQPKKGFPTLKNGKCCYNDQVAFKSDGDQGGQSSISGVQQHEKEVAAHITILPRINRVPPSKTELFRGPPEHSTHPNFQVLYQVFRI